MHWTPDGSTVANDLLGNLQPEEILVEFEGARTFTARDRQSELLLLHQCGESETAWRYSVVPFTDLMLEDLKSGKLDVLGALTQPRLWLVDIGPNGAIVNCHSSHVSKIPEDCKPQPGITLYPEHAPLLSVRAIGAHLSLEHATLGILREQVDSIRTGLRYLAEAALGLRPTKGPRPANTRAYYDLPARLYPGSVQVSVYPEIDPQGLLFDSDQTWIKMSRLLSWGFRQLSSSPDSLSADSDLTAVEKEAALRAVYALAPPARGTVSETEIMGKLVSRAIPEIHMGRQTRNVLNEKLKLIEEIDETEEPESMAIVRKEGYITELDLDEGTCLLRNDIGETIRKLSFFHDLDLADESLFEDVKEAFDSTRFVLIEGLELLPNNDLLLLAVSMPEVSPDLDPSDNT